MLTWSWDWVGEMCKPVVWNGLIKTHEGLVDLTSQEEGGMGMVCALSYHDLRGESRETRLKDQVYVKSKVSEIKEKGLLREGHMLTRISSPMGPNRTHQPP